RRLPDERERLAAQSSDSSSRSSAMGRPRPTSMVAVVGEGLVSPWMGREAIASAIVDSAGDSLMVGVPRAWCAALSGWLRGRAARLGRGGGAPACACGALLLLWLWEADLAQLGR